MHTVELKHLLQNKVYNHKIILPQFDLDMFMLANSKEATADDSLSCSFFKVWNFVSKFDVVLLRFSKKNKKKTNIC